MLTAGSSPQSGRSRHRSGNHSRIPSGTFVRTPFTASLSSDRIDSYQEHELAARIALRVLFYSTTIASNTVFVERFPRLFYVICKAEHFKIKWADHAVIG
jgi:hypothetical protein